MIIFVVYRKMVGLDFRFRGISLIMGSLYIWYFVDLGLGFNFVIDRRLDFG